MQTQSNGTETSEEEVEVMESVADITEIVLGDSPSSFAVLKGYVENAKLEPQIQKGNHYFKRYIDKSRLILLAGSLDDVVTKKKHGKVAELIVILKQYSTASFSVVGKVENVVQDYCQVFGTKLNEIIVEEDTFEPSVANCKKICRKLDIKFTQEMEKKCKSGSNVQSLYI